MNTGSSNTMLREVELSITATCSLTCAHCGFLVPNQPTPHRNPVEDIRTGLGHLDRLGFEIGSLAIMGGEATLEPALLTDVLRIAHEASNVHRVELVTNGLTPRGLRTDALPFVQRLSISDYTNDDALARAWGAWLDLRAPHVELKRRQHDAWDRWHDSVDLGIEGGQAAYDDCWYRRHCITLERGRLFVCSRIPKLGLDEQGLPLSSATTREDVLGYLSAPTAPAACRTCTPMAGLETVAPGIQPDDRVTRLRNKALRWFARQESA